MMRKPLGCVFHFVLDSGLFFDFFLEGNYDTTTESAGFTNLTTEAEGT